MWHFSISFHTLCMWKLIFFSDRLRLPQGNIISYQYKSEKNVLTSMHFNDDYLKMFLKLGDTF